MWKALIAAAFVGFTFAKEDEKKIDGPVIGIDLGTTYSCVPSLYEKIEDKNHLDGRNLGYRSPMDL